MPEAQISGHDPGSACRVPMVALSGLQTNAALSSVYRSGWTNTHTSESDSDLSEDTIKVTGYYYWKYNQGDSWILGDDSPCEDLRYNQSHAACRTYGSTGNYHKQDGYHYFHTSGYTDDSFQTTDTW
jgi:hypothetical protein